MRSGIILSLTEMARSVRLSSSSVSILARRWAIDGKFDISINLLSNYGFSMKNSRNYDIFLRTNVAKVLAI